MYIVLELQKTNKEDSDAASLINTYTDYKEAESKYYSILSYAALSKLFLHGAYLFSEEGNMIMNKQYIYEEPAPAPEPEPQPEPEPETEPSSEEETPQQEEVVEPETEPESEPTPEEETQEEEVEQPVEESEEEEQ